MADARNVCQVFGLMTITNEPLEPDI